LSLGGLNAHVSNYEQIGHSLGLLHCDLLNILDIAQPIVKDIDDLDVLDIWDSVLGVAETFHIVLEAFIMLLPDGLHGFSCRWTLVHTVKVLDEHDT
jgi:hypothetical protein